MGCRCLLCIYPEKTIIEKYTCTPVFTAALLMIARTQKPGGLQSIVSQRVRHDSSDLAVLFLGFKGISILKIRWTEEPGRLQSMGSLRVRHD